MVSSPLASSLYTFYLDQRQKCYGGLFILNSKHRYGVCVHMHCVCVCDVVDPELDSDTSSRPADTLNYLMSTMENTTTSTRKPHSDEEDQLSEEAARVICGLADLSFMKAKVLMFPITLTPAAGSGTLLE
uniref:Uncharacterized protein n=1 Tax=Oncorhynchus kisutch TaxID=8019 RepID=A0A8C7KMI9_ONCKI